MWLVIGVPVTVGLLIGLNAWLHGVRETRIEDLVAAAEQLARDHPSFLPQATTGTLVSGGRYALVPSTDGERLGLVAAHGASLTSRLLPPARLARLDRLDDRELNVRLDEPGWPTMRLLFDRVEECARWEASFSRLDPSRGSTH